MKKILIGGSLSVFAFFALCAMPASAAEMTVGNDTNVRANVDSYQNFTIIDTNNPAQFDGVLNKFEFYAANTNPFKFVVVDADGVVKWKSALVAPVVGVNTIYESTPVQAGWNVGMYFQSNGTIPFAYDNVADLAYYEQNNAGEPELGETLTKAGTTKRFYSFVATGLIDNDYDGVSDEDDKCSNTFPDVLNENLGVNRHIWSDGDYFTTLVPGTKGSKIEADSNFSLNDTFGCSCIQILDELKDAGLGEFGGHYKFGCSKGIMEEFSNDYNDGVIDGKYFIETVTVSVNTPVATESEYPLANGINYTLTASGTATACWQTGCKITFDPEYSTSDGITPWSTWSDGVAAPYTSYGPDLLDLKVNGGFVDWGTYNSLHSYDLSFVGEGNKINFALYDIAGSYFNDLGSLRVDIYAEL